MEQDAVDDIAGRFAESIAVGDWDTAEWWFTVGLAVARMRPLSEGTL